MKPTLLVLAAGMGSRYGGLKQLDPMGPGGETLLDYSVYDAMRAGFGCVTFVIRKDFEEIFRQQIGAKYEGRIEVRYVFQQLDMLPEGFTIPDGRDKPWGTTHAIWCARDVVKEPFAAINADDFYGAEAYRKLAEFLQAAPMDATPAQFAMVGYRLGNTLSDHGSVARGVCKVDAQSHLTHVVECTKIVKTATGAEQAEPDGSMTTFTGEEPVSMNFWGFMPAIFPMLGEEMVTFLKAHGTEAKSEALIPSTVCKLVEQGRASLKVLKTDSVWFGVTYRDDKPIVQEALRKLVAEGKYPAKLW
jgi:hypothetical protein